MKVSAVIVCAGNASRMGGINKIFASVNGMPVIAKTLTACEKSKCITDIVIVTKPENFGDITDISRDYKITKPLKTVAGGEVRAQSVNFGVRESDGDFVAIMDGARPLITPEHIDLTCETAFRSGAAALGVPVTDTLKRVEGDTIAETVDRANLVRIQTPQVFEKETYLALSDRALVVDYEFTDDCSVYEYFGKKVSIVYGSAQNIKVTVKEDIDICERLEGKMTRIGHGYDVHKLVSGRELWLCGEKIDFELGLDGHSDADVALHALIDALLGAAAMGDIGTLFPDTDMKYKNISSITLLKCAAELVFKKYRIANCDVTIIAQKPKLRPHIENMRKNIADALGVDIGRVSVKATTEEGLGFTGSLEGICAHAVCSLY